MTGFELRTSGIGSDHSTNWATTTALGYGLPWNTRFEAAFAATNFEAVT